MKTIILLAAFLCLAMMSNSQLTNNDAVYAAQINIALPNLRFELGNGYWIRIANGVLAEKNGPFMGATLSKKILNGDFNNDGYMDAAVILMVVYDGIGYWNNMVFVVLQNYQTGPVVTNGVVVGEVAIYQIDTFSTDLDGKKIILQFKDRLPGQPKAAATTVPTLVKLKVNNGVLVQDSKTTGTVACYPF